MKLIARGDIYDLPPYAECDLDALIVGIAIPNLVQMTADAITAAFRMPSIRILPTFHPIFPVAAPMVTPGALIETRSE